MTTKTQSKFKRYTINPYSEFLINKLRLTLLID